MKNKIDLSVDANTLLDKAFERIAMLERELMMQTIIVEKVMKEGEEDGVQSN